MAQFRKRPVVIEAVQFNGFNPEGNLESELNEFMRGQVSYNMSSPDRLIIKTLEGDMQANVGDWIIKGVHGEVYPCKPDIFEKTYEAV